MSKDFFVRVGWGIMQNIKDYKFHANVAITHIFFIPKQNPFNPLRKEEKKTWNPPPPKKNQKSVIVHSRTQTPRRMCGDLVHRNSAVCIGFVGYVDILDSGWFCEICAWQNGKRGNSRRAEPEQDIVEIKENKANPPVFPSPCQKNRSQASGSKQKANHPPILVAL